MSAECTGGDRGFEGEAAKADGVARVPGSGGVGASSGGVSRADGKGKRSQKIGRCPMGRETEAKNGSARC